MSAPAVEPAAPARAPIRDEHGYYHMPDGRKLISVTTIIDQGVPKPHLVPWAAREVARCAMEWLTRLVRARRDGDVRAAQEWLRAAAERKRDDAGALGGVIHDVIEAHILGAPQPALSDEQIPFVAAFTRFCQRWQPRWEAAEMVLANYHDGWAGTCDAWFWITLPDVGPLPVLVIADWKSGRNVYPEVALQLAAYSRAEVGYLRDGTQVVPPAADYAVVVHLRPEKYAGGYAVKRVDISNETYAAFLAAQRTAERWVHGHSKTVLQRAYREPPIPLTARKVA